MTNIYILELENGKYYVGKTKNPGFRLENHFSANGSEWTKLHKPIRVLKIIPDCDDYDEDKFTRIYMDQYGIDNVRGGSFVTTVLQPETLKVLKRMSNGTNDKCFKCGQTGHFVKNCRTTIISCRSCRNEFVTVDSFEQHTCVLREGIKYNICANGPSCFGCNSWDRCPSDRVEILFCDESKVMYDKNNQIYEKCGGKYNFVYHNTGLKYSKTQTLSCRRCGRIGHSIETCYAKIHFNGTQIQKF